MEPTTITGMSRVLTTEQLLHLTGYERGADLVRCLEAQGIRFFYGKGGKAWTTLDLLNAAAGLNVYSDREERPVHPDDLL